MRRESIEVRGIRLAALVAGRAGDPALLLLHGWPHCKEAYARVLDPLGNDHFVVAPDLPDVGESTGAPPSAEKKDLADIVLAVAEFFGARRPVIAGFDVGGMVAYAAARDHGARISGAMIMNTVIPGLDPWTKILADPRIWHFAFHQIPELPEHLVAGHQREYFEFFHRLLIGRQQSVGADCRAAFARAYERPESLKAGFDWYRAMPADAKRNAEPKAIDLPMLYLRGDADGRSPDEYARGIEAQGATRLTSQVVEGSGELMPLEVPEAFMRTLREFARHCAMALAA